MRAAALLVILSMGVFSTTPALASDNDPMLTRTVIFEAFSNPDLPSWHQDRQGGSINILSGALHINARTFTGNPTITKVEMENLSVNNCMVDFDITHRAAEGEAVFTFKNSGSSWYEVQFDAEAGQIRLEKWVNQQLAVAGIFGTFPMETSTTYGCRVAAVENFIFLQMTTNGIDWTTVFHFEDTEITAPGTVSFTARDLKDMLVDNLRIRAIAGNPANPVPEVVQSVWADNFSDEDTLCWIPVNNGGIVSLSEGTLLLRSAPSLTTQTRIDAVHLRNFVLEATVILKGWTGKASIDLRLDTSGENDSLFRVYLDPTVNQVQLEKHSGGTITPCDSKSYFLAENNSYQLQLICFEGRVYVGILGNGNPAMEFLITHIDTEVLPAGGIRFNAIDGKEIRIDNVVIKAIARFF